METIENCLVEYFCQEKRNQNIKDCINKLAFAFYKCKNEKCKSRCESHSSRI